MDFLFCLLSGFLTALSMPGFVADLFVWFSLVPLLFVLKRGRPFRNAVLTFLYFYTHTLITYFWVLPVLTENLPAVFGRFPPWIGVVTYLLMGGIVSFPFLGFGFMMGFAPENAILKTLYTASSYTIFEYLRGVGELGFTGGRLSDALFNRVGLIQICSITGTLGLVFLVVVVNALIAEFFGRKRFSAIVVVLCTVYVVDSLVARFLPLPTSTAHTKLLVVQQNVPSSVMYPVPSEKMLKILKEMVPEDNKTLVVTPEAFFLEDVRYTRVGEKLLEMSREMPMLIAFPAEGKNAVFLVKDGNFDLVYSKVKLFPFVEKLPYPTIFGVFSFLRGLEYYEPGEKFSVINLEGLPPFSVQICFESYFPEVSRAFVRNGSELLIVVTNDGWFHHRVALLNHFVQCVFRAVENRRFFVQVANTGITGVVDEYGRILKVIPPGRWADTLEVKGVRVRTFYSKYGDYVVYIAVFVPLFCLVTGKKRRKGVEGR